MVFLVFETVVLIAAAVDAGNFTVMLVPEPGVLAASIRPPWASTMALQIASPSPAWPSAPERAAAVR